jgi:hypothetical protein
VIAIGVAATTLALGAWGVLATRAEERSREVAAVSIADAPADSAPRDDGAVVAPPTGDTARVASLDTAATTAADATRDSLLRDDPLTAREAAVARAAARRDSVLRERAMRDSIARLAVIARRDSAVRRDSLARLAVLARRDSLARIVAAARRDSLARRAVVATRDSMARRAASARRDSVARIAVLAAEEREARRLDSMVQAARERRDSLAALRVTPLRTDSAAGRNAFGATRQRVGEAELSRAAPITGTVPVDRPRAAAPLPARGTAAQPFALPARPRVAPSAAEVQGEAERVATRSRMAAQFRDFFADGDEHAVAIARPPAVREQDGERVRVDFDVRLAKFDGAGRRITRLATVTMDVLRDDDAVRTTAVTIGALRRP